MRYTARSPYTIRGFGPFGTLADTADFGAFRLHLGSGLGLLPNAVAVGSFWGRSRTSSRAVQTSQRRPAQRCGCTPGPRPSRRNHGDADSELAVR
jgi:hypothetical protein